MERDFDTIKKGATNIDCSLFCYRYQPGNKSFVLLKMRLPESTMSFLLIFKNAQPKPAVNFFITVKQWDTEGSNAVFKVHEKQSANIGSAVFVSNSIMKTCVTLLVEFPGLFVAWHSLWPASRYVVASIWMEVHPILGIYTHKLLTLPMAQ